MKIATAILGIMICAFAGAQQDSIFRDKDGARCAREMATSYTVLTKQNDNSFAYRDYIVKGNKLRETGTYLDTATRKVIGPAKLYYESGVLEDSSVYDADGNRTETYHYYPNRHLAYRYVAAKNGGKGMEEGYDENGKKLKNYIYEKEAEFKGGDKAWLAFIAKNATTEFVNIKPGVTQLTVKVQFTVEGDGSVGSPKIVQSSGVRAVDKDAIRVIMLSPLWKNAVQYNKPVRVYRLQPITYSFDTVKK